MRKSPITAQADAILSGKGVCKYPASCACPRCTVSGVKPVGQTGTVDDITLRAVNTRALYQKHVRLARAKVSDEHWLAHTLLFVLPTYRQDTHTIEHFDAEIVKRVACNLRDYYAQHIAES